MIYLIWAIRISLTAPLLWEIPDDAHGDLNKKRDVVIRVMIAVASAFLNWVFGLSEIWSALLLSLAIHFLIFDYWIAYLLVKNKVIRSQEWFNVIGKKGVWDNIGWWNALGGWGKLAVRVIVFTMSLIAYIIW